MLLRACSLAPVGILPTPAPLPSLRDAITRRALLFGPVEADAAPGAPPTPWQALGDIARSIIEALTPGFRS